MFCGLHRKWANLTLCNNLETFHVKIPESRFLANFWYSWKIRWLLWRNFYLITSSSWYLTIALLVAWVWFLVVYHCCQPSKEPHSPTPCIKQCFSIFSKLLATLFEFRPLRVWELSRCLRFTPSHRIFLPPKKIAFKSVICRSKNLSRFVSGASRA